MATCQGCKFFKLGEPDVKLFGNPKPVVWGECWRYPPTPVGAGSVSSQGVNGFARSIRPDVHIEHFCGEFAP